MTRTPTAPATTRVRLFLQSRLTLDLLWALVVPVAVLIYLSAASVQPNDFWWHVRTGQITLQTRSIPTTDLFSFTRYGHTWVNQAWLMQVWLYLLYAAGGLPLIIFWHAVAVSAGYALLQAAVLHGGRPVLPALATFAAVAIGVRNWAVRPQGISFLFMGLLVYLLERHWRGHSRTVWAMVPLFALWANCHGAFVFGLAYLGLYVAGRVWDALRAGAWAAERRHLARLALITGACIGALAVNPEGPDGVVSYVFGFVRSQPTMQANVEFMPLSARTPDGAAFFIALLVLAVGLSSRHQGLAAHRWMPLAALAAGSLWASRVVPWSGFALAPALADLYRRRGSGVESPRRGRTAANLALVALLAVALIYFSPWLRPILRPAGTGDWTSPMTPVAACDFLCREAPAGSHVFQEQGFASYQIWACPQLPVFVDTRIELYPLEHWRKYLAVSGGRFDWESVLERFEVDYLLLSLAAQEHAVRAAGASPNWQELYRDDRAAVFVRTGPGQAG